MRVLQSLIQLLQGSDMVRPLNNLFLFLFVTLIVGKVYYQLYVNDGEIPSKVAFDLEEPSIGRIRADCVALPHSPTSIKRCISRVERNPALLHSDLFADTSCDTPLTEGPGHISILRTDGPGMSPEGGVNLQVLQSLVQRLQGSDMVRPFKTPLFKFFS